MTKWNDLLLKKQLENQDLSSKPIMNTPTNNETEWPEKMINTLDKIKNKSLPQDTPNGEVEEIHIILEDLLFHQKMLPFHRDQKEGMDEVRQDIKKLENLISSLLESARSDERKKIAKRIEEAIVGCAWVDLEDGNGRYVHVGQLLENIRRNLDLSE